MGINQRAEIRSWADEIDVMARAELDQSAILKSTDDSRSVDADSEERRAGVSGPSAVDRIPESISKPVTGMAARLDRIPPGWPVPK